MNEIQSLLFGYYFLISDSRFDNILPVSSLSFPLYKPVLLNKEYNESADVYGFGIVLWVRFILTSIYMFFVSYVGSISD